MLIKEEEVIESAPNASEEEEESEFDEKLSSIIEKSEENNTREPLSARMYETVTNVNPAPQQIEIQEYVIPQSETSQRRITVE